MEQRNPYQAPDAVVADVDTDGELAGRGTRFGAAFLDSLILIAIMWPMMYVGGYWGAVASGQQPGLGMQLAWILVGMAIFVLVQGYPLHATGQTWGKRLLGIRIVDMQEQKPSLGKLLGQRYLPYHAISGVPMLGPLLALVNVLLIFRSDRRCGHDLIAGTKVIKAN